MKVKCPNCGGEETELIYTVENPYINVIFGCYKCLDCGNFFVEKVVVEHEAGR